MLSYFFEKIRGMMSTHHTSKLSKVPTLIQL
nr:MAG TPA: Transcription factor [Caudoviricetes sp.]